MNCGICGKELTPTQKRFCSKRCAGLYVGHHQGRIPDSEYLDDLVAVKNQLGRYPTSTEYQEIGVNLASTLIQRFGSWGRALELIGYKRATSTWSLDSITPEEGGWLAGFYAGEGAFTLQRGGNPRRYRFDAVATLSQRADNLGPIKEILRLWNLTALDCHLRRNPPFTKRRTNFLCNPTHALTIRRTKILAERVIPTFLCYPMRSKKQEEFLIWKEAVQIYEDRSWQHRHRYSEAEYIRLGEIFSELKAMRVYHTPTEDITFRAPHGGKGLRV